MHCPACREPLAVLEHDLVEVDYCLSCGGLWLDAGEMALLTHAQASEDLERLATRATRRKCPECGTRLREGTVGDSPPVVYDACPRCDGIWFDQGELHAVLASAGTVRPEVTHWLREVFGEGANAGAAKGV